MALKNSTVTIYDFGWSEGSLGVHVQIPGTTEIVCIEAMVREIELDPEISRSEQLHDWNEGGEFEEDFLGYETTPIKRSRGDVVVTHEGKLLDGREATEWLNQLDARTANARQVAVSTDQLRDLAHLNIEPSPHLQS